METYISKRSKVRGVVMRGAVLLGPSVVEDGSFIDMGVIIGYPLKDKIKKISEGPSEELLDDASEGARIGKNCLIRCGTVIYEGVEIGDGVEIGHSVLIRAGSSIGKGAKIGSHSQLDGAVSVGEGSNIQSMVYVPHSTKIGKRVFIGPMTCITNDRYPASERLLGVVIENDVVIGAASLLMAGIKIGRGAVIAAGSLVTRDVEEEEFVLGSPARRMGSREDYERKKRIYEEARE